MHHDLDHDFTAYDYVGILIVGFILIIYFGGINFRRDKAKQNI